MKINEIEQGGEVQSMINQNSAYLGIIDSKGNFIFINSCFSHSLHSNVLTILHTPFFEFIHTADLESFGQAMAHCSLTRSATTVEVRLKGSNFKWVRWQISHTGNPANSPERFLLEGTDIPGEHHIRLFASFMDHSPGFAWIINEEDKLIYANRRLLDYFHADKTVLNKFVHHILPKPIADASREKHKWVLENDLPHSSILRSLLADGKEHVFDVNVFPVRGDCPKKMVGGQAWDITESWQAKGQLKKTNERLLYLSRAVSEAIWDWNMQTDQIFRNEPLLKMIGYHEEKSDGLSWWYKHIHPEDREKVEKKIGHILATNEKAWEQEYRFLCADGSYKIVLDRGFVVYENEEPVRMVGSLQDISEIKQLEAELFREKLRKQKQIAEAILQAQEQERTRIGHELHDNVNQILFTSKLYLDLIKPLDEEEKKIKGKTQEFILLAIEEIRKLSKELVTPQLKEYGLIRCINELLDQLGIIEPFHTDVILGDEYKIEALSFNIKVTLFRIIQEQIKNIIKHSQAKKVLLNLSVKEKVVHLLIQDDGIGFDARKTRRGIGLSNIYERTSLYNGKVDLQTQPGKGCSIRIVVPFA